MGVSLSEGWLKKTLFHPAVVPFNVVVGLTVVRRSLSSGDPWIIAGNGPRRGGGRIAGGM